ncbi:thioredoxin-dependent thiol peroxidase [bacterium]|nr:thioredoxin-dependent thiol peroxidase [bacterium]
MGELHEGDKAPAFELPASTGGTIALADFLGRQHLVLYFYPKDMTPGCTQEACSFRDLHEEFNEAGAAILGVSVDSLDSHAKFVAKHELSFPLLSDAGALVAQAYGVWKEKNMYGKRKMGVERSTFVIDRSGLIRRVWRKVKVNEHADEVLEFVRQLA